MTARTPGKIFLADQRGLTQTTAFRRYSTFNFGSYQHEHKAALGPLQAVNEEMLAGGQQVAFAVAEATHVLVLPITGSVTVHAASGEAAHVAVEEVQLLAVPAGGTIAFHNPYETELISFLHIWLRAATPIAAASQVAAFGTAAIENQLATLVPAASGAAALSLGRFAGRHEAVYRPAQASLFFAFVLAGAFEIEGRLLHERDGLALWNVAAVELEALSNDALVLVLEVKR